MNCVPNCSTPRVCSINVVSGSVLRFWAEELDCCFEFF